MGCSNSGPRSSLQCFSGVLQPSTTVTHNLSARGKKSCGRGTSVVTVELPLIPGSDRIVLVLESAVDSSRTMQLPCLCILIAVVSSKIAPTIQNINNLEMHEPGTLNARRIFGLQKWCALCDTVDYVTCEKQRQTTRTPLPLQLISTPLKYNQTSDMDYPGPVGVA